MKRKLAEWTHLGIWSLPAPSCSPDSKVPGQLGSLDSEGSGHEWSRGPTCTPVCPSLFCLSVLFLLFFYSHLREERRWFPGGKGEERVVESST